MELEAGLGNVETYMESWTTWPLRTTLMKDFKTPANPINEDDNYDFQQLMKHTISKIPFTPEGKFRNRSLTAEGKKGV